jgi:hypothetical protein
MKIAIIMLALLCIESDNWNYTPTLTKDQVLLTIKALEFYSKNAVCGEDMTAPEAIRLKKVLDIMRKPVKEHEANEQENTK